MDVIHNIKIPSVHIGSVDPTADTSLAPSGEGGQPTPITYLTQWKIVGNSEVHEQEIWSCGEYNATDGKYHIFVQPLGGSIADIPLTEPLRKVNDVADTIEYPSNTEGKALVTRNIASIPLGDFNFNYNANPDRLCFDVPYSANRSFVAIALLTNAGGNIMVASYENIKWSTATNINKDMCIAMSGNGDLRMRDLRYNDLETFKTHIADYEMLFLLATPTTELVDAPQIEEADSYTCVISQGAKAVSWSSFSID